MNFDDTPLTIFWSLDFLNLDLDPESDNEHKVEDDSDNDAFNVLAHVTRR